MGLGVSLILIAVGAILTWAVEADVSGLNVNAVGVILMIVGLIGGLLSLAFLLVRQRRVRCATLSLLGVLWLRGGWLKQAVPLLRASVPPLSRV
jgi:hypothetical protein